MADLNRQVVKKRRKSGTEKPTSDRLVKNIRRKTRKHHSAEEGVRIVLEGLRSEESIAAVCRREGIAKSLYYLWSQEFVDATTKRIGVCTAGQAASLEVKS